MLLLIRASLLCCLIAASTLSASTGYIQGVIKEVGDSEFVITGVNLAVKEEAEEAQDHKIPGQGDPIYILDGQLATRSETVVPGRQCFVFWNRHTQQMVVALSGEAGGVTPQAAPEPFSADNAHCAGGTILRVEAESEEVVLQTAAGTEVTVTPKQGKTIYVLGTRFTPFAEAMKPGLKAVAFCYRKRSYPNFVVAFEPEPRPADTP